MSKHHLIKIKDWIFDPSTKSLRKDDGTDETVTLENKQCLLLQFLIENHSQVVNRDQLIETVWFGRIVEELTINAVVSRLRKVLGGEKNDYIKTHPKIGYSLVSEIKFIEKEIVEPETIKISVPKSSASDLTHKMRYSKNAIISFIAIGFIIILVSFIIFKNKEINSTPPTNINISNSVTPLPLTYQEGWELSADLSPDKKLLAFVHKTNADSNMQVMVKNINTNKTISIDDNYTTSPKWSKDGKTLFYQNFIKEKCLIKSVAIDKDLNLNKTNKITSCGNILSMSPLAIDNTWLYFSYKLNDTEPFVIKRFNLDTKQEETLTAPPIKHYGDYSLSLDNSGHKLAFIRSITNTKHELMYLNLISGEVKFLTSFSHVPYQIDWNPTADSIVFVNENYTLSSINIDSLKVTPLYQSSEQIIGPKIISDNELLLIIGDFYTSDIKQLNLAANDTLASNLISSSFNDFAASQSEGNEDITAFVSNRTGKNQLWISDTNEIYQLTNFKETHLLSDLKLSFDASKLLFTKNHQLFSIDIKSKTISEITKKNEYIKSPIWLCSSKDSILTIFHSKGESNLYLINSKNGTKEKLQASINSVKSDCKNNQYYVSKLGVDGIYKLTDDWHIEQDSYRILNTNFADYYEWEVYENNLYYTKHNKFYKLNLMTKKQTELFKGEFSVGRFSLSNNRLLYTKRNLNNTYVAKMKIKTSL